MLQIMMNTLVYKEIQSECSRFVSITIMISDSCAALPMASDDTLLHRLAELVYEMEAWGMHEWLLLQHV